MFLFALPMDVNDDDTCNDLVRIPSQSSMGDTIAAIMRGINNTAKVFFTLHIPLLHDSNDVAAALCLSSCLSLLLLLDLSVSLVAARLLIPSPVVGVAVVAIRCCGAIGD
jgi:hypothetical protein